MMLQSYLAGRWQTGTGDGSPLIDPVTGEELVRLSGTGLDLVEALDHARTRGGPALRVLTFEERGRLLAAIADVLGANRDAYAEIALRNSGNTARDAALDIDGGIGTLQYYAGLGQKLLGPARVMVEAGADRLTRDKSFKGRHLWTPVRGVAVHINAFNFPSWGLWEKVAVSILSGVPCLAKPASATAWLTWRMVADVVAADILPDGVLSLLCGGGRELVDLLGPDDLVAFTGSAETASALRARAMAAGNPRFTVEADSLNLCCFGPDAGPDSAEFAAAVKEVVREMTVKAGQKCTAIRRILVPRAHYDAAASAIAAGLARVTVGDPRDPEVRMGPLVSKAQQRAAWDGLDTLSAETRVVTGGDRDFVPAGVTAEAGCFVPPTLLACDAPLSAKAVHAVEVFGPVATLMPYDSVEEAAALARMGGGSLAGSVFTADAAFARAFVTDSACAHGRLLVVDASVADGHSGHGVVMPQCVHGGPGRAGGGEELGGLRGLRFYHQRTALQGSETMLAGVLDGAVEVAL